ncbi:hypothetical protein ADK96_06035 [Streptomyces sp. IGB124]|nr:hypothetical protein ADK96_06035 [Streptomyces sp. IGB124]
MHRYEAHFGRLVLRGRGGGVVEPSGLVEIEFRHVAGNAGRRGLSGLLIADASGVSDAAGVDVVAEMEAFVPSQPTLQFKQVLLSDDTRWGFVVCHSVSVHRFDSPVGCGR